MILVKLYNCIYLTHDDKDNPQKDNHKKVSIPQENRPLFLTRFINSKASINRQVFHLISRFMFLGFKYYIKSYLDFDSQILYLLK